MNAHYYYKEFHAFIAGSNDETHIGTDGHLTRLTREISANGVTHTCPDQDIADRNPFPSYTTALSN